jgi:hypothetical protein
MSGGHRYGVRCHSCRAVIPLFDDNSRGASPLPLLGPGKLKISCHACESQGYYAVEEFVAMEGDRND